MTDITSKKLPTVEQVEEIMIEPTHKLKNDTIKMTKM